MNLAVNGNANINHVNGVVKQKTSRVYNGLIRVNIDKLQGINATVTLKINNNDTPSITTDYSEGCSSTNSKIQVSSCTVPSNQNTRSFYERTLLKKKHGELKKDKSFDFCDSLKDEKTSDDQKDKSSPSSERKFWRKGKREKNKNDPKRHHSFSYRKKMHLVDRGYESSGETKRHSLHTSRITELSDKGYQSSSPTLTSKIERPLSMKSHLTRLECPPVVNDSAASTETETDHEGSKIGKISLKRRKSQLKEQMQGQLKEDKIHERKMSRFRRRRSSDNIRYKYRNTSKERNDAVQAKNLIQRTQSFSKVLKFYSGKIDNSEAGKFVDDLHGTKIIRELDKNNTDIVSQAVTKRERNQKQMEDVATHMCKSSNNLVQSNEEKVKANHNNSMIHTPPLVQRKISTYHRLSKSLPGGLDKCKDDGKTTSVDRYPKDNLYNVNIAKDTKNSLTAQKREMNSLRREKTSTLRSKVKYKRRSKSLDFLSESQLHIINKEQTAKDKDQPRRRRSFTNLIRKNSLSKLLHGKSNINNDYKIILSQDPSRNKHSVDLSPTLSKKEHNLIHGALNLAELDRSKNSINSNTDFTRLRLTDLKSTLKQELEFFLREKVFDCSEVNTWCCTLAESIKDRVILLTEEKYKIIAQVFIGALLDHGIHAAIQSTCDKNKDGFFAVTYRGNDMFAIASILAFDVST